MQATADTLNKLYDDTKACATLVGLSYVEGEKDGITRIKHGKGFAFKHGDQAVTDKRLRARIAKLVIPPAWQNVWICPSPKGHVLVTGVDERGRKQYIYHPKWRTVRDLIKFYRMIVFAAALPKIRKDIEKHLQESKLSRSKVIATMLWLLDNAYIRIGNQAYYQENESVGLTTLTDKNIIIASQVVTLAYKGKSGKNRQIAFEDKRIANILEELRQAKGARLFRYPDGNGVWHQIDSSDINKYLQDLTGTHVSAKDFRTWGGTLMAFLHLVELHRSPEEKKPEKAVIEAVDQAAAVLGNTRAVARSSYVHPHLLSTYGSKNFKRYYGKATKQRKVSGLDKHENELLHFLQQLFEEEFELLKQ